MPPLDDYGRWMHVTDRTETAQAGFLAGLLYGLLRPASVIDWGCASGLYLTPFLAFGCRVRGLDAEATAGRLLDGHFERADLRLDILRTGYDLALCIEVGEHLQAEYADQFVRNVTRSAPVLLWSAAVPGQGGLHHHNEQPTEYWLEKLAGHGFGPHPLDGQVREAVGASPVCLWWLKRNAQLLGRERVKERANA